MTGATARSFMLSDEALDDLELNLAIACSKLTPGAQRVVRGPGRVATTQVPPEDEMQSITSEIVQTYRSGIGIASHAESRPLIPLFKAAKVVLPPELQVDHEQLQYDFYSVELIFSSLLPRDQFLLQAHFELHITDDVAAPERQTRPIRLFPGRKDIQLFSADFEGAIGIDAGLNVEVPKIGSELIPYTTINADANVKLKAGMVIGPFHFPFRRAAIEVLGESNPTVIWRYNLESELMGTNEFKSLLILKVAGEARAVSIAAALEVVPCKRRWLVFKEELLPIPAKIVLPVELAGRSP